jgi:hypothetical protein
MDLRTGLCCALLLVALLPLSANASSKVRYFLFVQKVYLLHSFRNYPAYSFLTTFCIEISALHSVYGG